jgi:hypothetical protein
VELQQQQLFKDLAPLAWMHDPAACWALMGDCLAPAIL